MDNDGDVVKISMLCRDGCIGEVVEGAVCYECVICGVCSLEL